MVDTKISKTLFLIALSVFSFSMLSKTAYAQIAECDEDQEFIKSSWCPCPEDEAYASLCGLVNNARIVQESSVSIHREVYATRQPVHGVTVTLYENDPEVPTGQPFGNYEKKLVACWTTEEEGKYFCPMRRINPGFMHYVVFSCGDEVVDIKIVPSSRSLTGVNSDVDCDVATYTSLPDTLEYAERDSFLGCTTVDEDELLSGETVPSPNVGFEDLEILYTNTYVEEEGGDIRFSDFDGVSVVGFTLMGEHPGAYNEKDCLVRYRDDVIKEFSPLGLFGYAAEPPYDATAVKCNLDEDMDGYGAMYDWDEYTTPFRYDIPNRDEEYTHRVWETRKVVQREYQDPRGWLQYNHMMYGECVGNAFLRYRGDDDEELPLSCSILANCGESLGDPVRNIHTTESLGSRLGAYIDFIDIQLTEERDPQDIICRDYTGEFKGVDEDVYISECKPPYDAVPCVPGEGGCPYLMDTNECYMPQFFIDARAMKKPKTDHAFGDSYGEQGARYEDYEWDEIESHLPHESGNYMNYECKDALKGNCASSAVRISSTQLSDVGGVLQNRFIGSINAIDEIYDYQPDITIWDVGGDVRSLCAINNINDLFIPDLATEAGVLPSNEFQGVENEHIDDER
ncbi:hypothetical protein ACFL0C_00105, partial [Patescibacteria group bacterium]